MSTESALTQKSALTQEQLAALKHLEYELSSGRFKQAEGKLYSGSNQWCCLGVACKIVNFGEFRLGDEDDEGNIAEFVLKMTYYDVEGDRVEWLGNTHLPKALQGDYGLSAYGAFSHQPSFVINTDYRGLVESRGDACILDTLAGVNDTFQDGFVTVCACIRAVLENPTQTTYSITRNATAAEIGKQIVMLEESGWKH